MLLGYVEAAHHLGVIPEAVPEHRVCPSRNRPRGDFHGLGFCILSLGLQVLQGQVLHSMRLSSVLLCMGVLCLTYQSPNPFSGTFSTEQAILPSYFHLPYGAGMAVITWFSPSFPECMALTLATLPCPPCPSPLELTTSSSHWAKEAGEQTHRTVSFVYTGTDNSS